MIAPARWLLAALAFVPMLLGVTSLAAGVKLTIGTIETRLPVGPALLLGGGVALYLVGITVFRRAMRITQSSLRLGAAALALATAGLGTAASGLAQLIALLITLVLMLVLEAHSKRKSAPSD